MSHPLQHFITITRHRHRVIAHCFRAGIGWQGLFHDLSKYMPSEFWAGARYYQGSRSPNAAEREVNGYSLAWMHHKGRNRHHFEYWIDYNTQSHRAEPVPMPPRYVVEMLCDRMAASKVYQGKAYTDQSPLDYFYRGKKSRSIHPQTSDQLEHLLTMLAKEGEDAVFAYTRRWLKEEKRGNRHGQA